MINVMYTYFFQVFSHHNQLLFTIQTRKQKGKNKDFYWEIENKGHTL